MHQQNDKSSFEGTVIILISTGVAFLIFGIVSKTAEYIKDRKVNSYDKSYIETAPDYVSPEMKELDEPYKGYEYGDKSIQRPIKMACDEPNKDLGPGVLYIYSKQKSRIGDKMYRHVGPNDFQFVYVNDLDIYQDLDLNKAYNCNFVCDGYKALNVTSCDTAPVNIPEQEDELLEKMLEEYMIGAGKRSAKIDQDNKARCLKQSNREHERGYCSGAK